MNSKSQAFFSLVVVLLSTFAAESHAQVSRTGLLSTTAARRFGLERSWYTQIALDRSRSRVTFVTPYVSSTKTHTVYDVVWETGKLEFSELERDAFDELVGTDGAIKAANAKIKELKDAGFDPKLITNVIPEISLYVATDRGVLHAIDAESGKTRWARAVGRPEHPNLEPGVNEKYVGVVNGSILNILNRDTGELVWDRKLGGAPGAGPGLTENYAFAPLVNGKLEVYRLASLDELERKFRAPAIRVSIGRPLLQPVTTPSSCAWATDRGFMYVSSTDSEVLRFRTEAADTVVAPVTSLPRLSLLFMASVDGYVYCVQELTGEVIWRFSAGAPVTSSAIPVGDAVYVISDDGGVFKVNLETGTEDWWAPRIHRFIAASENRVYCTDRIGRMVILDNKSGGRIATLDTEQLDLFIPNFHTDRIYVGTKSGLLQCFRETELERPIVYRGPGNEPKETIQVKTGDDPPAAGGTTPAPAGDNPFGTTTPSPPAGGTPPDTTNPFGATPTPPAGATPKPPPASDNPFGA